MCALLALGIPALFWRLLPVMTQFPLVLVLLLDPPVVALILIWRLERWTRSSHWNDRHLLALISGMLIAHSVIGGLLLSKTAVEAGALAVMGLLMVVFLGGLSVQIRRREAIPTISS